MTDAAPLAWYVWTQGYAAGWKDSESGDLTRNPYATTGACGASEQPEPHNRHSLECRLRVMGLPIDTYGGACEACSPLPHDTDPHPADCVLECRAHGSNCAHLDRVLQAEALREAADSIEETIGNERVTGTEVAAWLRREADDWEQVPTAASPAVSRPGEERKP